MANKPFEIQGNSLSIGGVELTSSSDGKVVVPGITKATGYKLIAVKLLGESDTYSPDAKLTIFDNNMFLDYTDNGILNEQYGTSSAFSHTINCIRT